MLCPEKELLQALIRIPSVNPRFQQDPSDLTGEAELTDFLQEYCDDRGWPWLRQQVHPERENLVAVCRGETTNAAEPPLLWEVHQDTVSTEGMQIDPFAAVEEDGRIWGRGACDVKGGMAAMLAALDRLLKEGTSPARPIVLAFTVNEESGFSGAKALCRLWETPPDLSQKQEQVLGPLTLEEFHALRPQRVIVAEPTQLQVVFAHKGVVRWQCHTHGRAAHSSQPEQGSNAIYAMADVVRAIVSYYEQVMKSRPPHEHCGPATVSVGTIHGGKEANTVPDHAVIDVDRRLMPEESTIAAYQELIDYIAAHVSLEGANQGVTIRHDAPWLESMGLSNERNVAWAEEIADVVRSVQADSRIQGVPYGTDAGTLAAHGYECIVFGPGSIEQAHTANEWLAIDQLSQATEVFYRLAKGGAGSEE